MSISNVQQLLENSDIAHLLQVIPGTVVNVVPHSIINTSTSSPRCLVLTMDSGERYKLRMLAADWTARRTYWIWKNTPLWSNLAKLYGCKGSYILEEWVAGESLASEPLSRAAIEEAGALFGRFHASVFRQPFTNRAITEEYWRARIRELVSDITLMDECSHTQASTLIARLSSRIPTTISGGVIHQDYCPENIIRRTDTELIIIDLEHLDFGSYAYDLARAQLRWELSDDDWEFFLDAYTRHCAPQHYHEHALFWNCVAVLASARFHFKAKSDSCDKLREQLKTTLEKLD